MAGNFTSLAARLVDARRAVETKFDDDTGKPKRRSCTPSSKFIKEICGLIPSDLLLATNFYWSPKLICSSEVSKLQRYSDVESMLHRIALWYEFMLPADDGSNSDDIRILLNLREWFDQLDRATKEHMQSLNQARNSGKASDCDDDCRCEICGYCCFYGCDTCTRCLFEVEKQFHTNQGVADAVGGGSYSGGAVGLVNGEFGGYFAASSNQQCHDWCRGVCGGEFANICCFCVQSDKGTAAAVNGGPPPNNCCGQMSFHTAKCVEETRGCYCGCFQEIGNICCTCGEGLVQVIQGLGTGIQRLCEGFSRTLCNCDGSMCHAVAHIFDFDCSGFNGR